MSAPFAPTTPAAGTDSLTAMCRAFAGAEGNHAADPAVAAYIAWVEAVATYDRTSDEVDALAQGHPEKRAKFAIYEEAVAKREEAEEVMDKAVAATPLGALARFAYFTYWTSGCMYEGDIKLWQAAVGDISRLGVLPLPAEVRAFGEGRFFGSLHRVAMTKEGIDPSGRSITLPSSLWEPAPERAGVIYDLPVGVAERMATECDRNRAYSASNPGRADQEARVSSTFGRLTQERQELFIKWLEFIATGGHLHAATLEFARENDLLDQYRDQILNDLRDVETASYLADHHSLPEEQQSALRSLVGVAVRGGDIAAAVASWRVSCGGRAEDGEELANVMRSIHRRRHGNADVGLLHAYEEWLRLTRMQEVEDHEARPEAEIKAVDEAAYAARDRLEAQRPQTLEGVAAQLRYLFAKFGENRAHYDAVLNGTEPEADALDCRERLLWQVIQAVEGMTARGRASE
ncbi:MAG: hypothetical protein ACLGJC_30500 [Alphaproteobacteria bacterium]